MLAAQPNIQEKGDDKGNIFHENREISVLTMKKEQQG
jgi:hypothetical protein